MRQPDCDHCFLRFIGYGSSGVRLIDTLLSLVTSPRFVTMPVVAGPASHGPSTFDKSELRNSV